MVDFTRFMGRGALEPRFAPMPLEPLPAIKPAPQVKAPAPAPLPSVEPAPMPAPVAPLPTPIPSFAPDPMNIPGLPQLPMPAPVPPVAQPAPVPAPVPTPVPLPQAEPMPPVKPVEPTPPIMELPNVPPVPVTPPPMLEPTPVPAPVPVTPPPLPPTPVAPPPMLEPTPVPAPVPVTPPPLPPQPVPTPVAPPPVVEPAPTPTPITPPPTPFTPGFDMLEPGFEVEPGILPNLPTVPTPVAPPPAVEPAPTPVAPEFTLPPELLESLPPMVRPPVVEPMPTPAPTPAPTPVAPEPAVGIETLAPEDFTAPAGIVAGPMSTPAVNNRVEAMEANIPLPSGGQFNLDRMEFDTESIPEIDPQIIQNALADAGLAPAPVMEPAPVAEPAPTITPNLGAGLTLGDTYLTEPQVNLFNERELADMSGAPATRGDMVFAGGTPNFDERTGQYVEPTPEPAPTSNEFTLTPEQQAAVDAAIAQGEFGFTGDSYGFTDGQQDAAGVAPGAVAETSADALTGPYAGMEFYQNMTPEQRQAFDDFIASGGIANLPGGTIDLGAIGGGTINLPGYGGYTGTTPRPVVEAIQNLGVNRDPGAAQASVATQYGLTGAPPVQTPSTNPFRRPESQQGIGSLAGGG